MVKTAGCGSVMRGFESHYPPHKNVGVSPSGKATDSDSVIRTVTLANKKARSKCFGSFAISRESSDCNVFDDFPSVHVSAVRCTQLPINTVYVQRGWT